MHLKKTGDQCKEKADLARNIEEIAFTIYRLCRINQQCMHTFKFPAMFLNSQNTAYPKVCWVMLRLSLFRRDVSGCISNFVFLNIPLQVFLYSSCTCTYKLATKPKINITRELTYANMRKFSNPMMYISATCLVSSKRNMSSTGYIL